ncbi:MAG TPA: CaiB/BaiF CoA-transferase family protein [Polyangiales bacterium]|nr:CaiB/BaiF CoA-transferase family protein [Polyangiales bacterium]
MSAGPLSDLRVLDLSRVLAGPYVGRLLADLGAEVVKVEPPEGDVTRNWGRVIAGLSGYYTQQNVGKQGICIDLRRDGAPQLVRRLASRADILVENFRPGVLKQYGLSYEELAPDNPRLLMLSISGYGQAGPEAQRAAYASVIHAESGVVHRQAAIDGVQPVDPHISIADTNAGLHGLVGILAALHGRDRTGRGQHLDVAMLDAMLATDDQLHLALDDMPMRHNQVNEIWEVSFGQVTIAGDFRWIWRQLSESAGLVDPTPAGAPLEQKISLRRETVRNYLRSLPDRVSVFGALERADLAFGEVRSSQAALMSETARVRGTVVPVDDRAGGMRRVIQSPYRFSASKTGAGLRAPYRGEHNHDVLERWLELRGDEIAKLEHEGVLLREEVPR